ncbi:lytic transglycosylase domain-containing protein [Clostridium rectalis]|uniref:lytic transglycosylase domain-containing protein n=1 Tax=Clostridium rectalis TaxID=2040295 RepID=UPI000F640CAB|nr:lytic transglycosylase domain-containing protein [Clostridium rectalis]
MKVDDDKRVEQLLQFKMMTQVLKSTFKDSDSFALVLESLTQAMTDKNGSIDMKKLGISQKDLFDLGHGGKERLTSAVNQISSKINSGNLTIDELVEKASKKYCIDKELLFAVIKQESDFDPNCTSYMGAMGLMQLMPETASDLGINNPYNIEENIDGGAKHLRGYLNMYGNCKELALAAYNAGPGTLQNRGVKNVEAINRLPYETRDYVKKVMKYYGK